MNIEIKNVLDVGVLARERVVLRVIRDANVGDFLLAQGMTQTDGAVSQAIRPLLWFPDELVKAGDLVVVYTKAGRPKTKTNADESTSRFYYLGLEKSVWSAPKRAALLAYIEEWEFLAIPPEDDTTQEPA